MRDCIWEEIHSFNSPVEYKRFYTWLVSQINEHIAEEIPVGISKKEVPYGIDQKWFKCKKSGKVWSLAAPDPPFLGFWIRIEFY